MRPGPAAVLGLLSGAAAQTGTGPERRNGVQQKGKKGAMALYAADQQL